MKPTRYASAEVWRGPSAIGAGAVRLVLTGMGARGSQNSQTGPMVQCWILPVLSKGVTIHKARREGTAAACGTCPRQPHLARAAGLAPCFVRPHGLGSAEKCKVRAPLDVVCRQIARGSRGVRLGAWGDPGALPLDVVRALRAAVPAGLAWTSYSHAWATLNASDWSGLTMASVDSPEERDEAQAAGWRTYRAARIGDPGSSDRDRVCPTVYRPAVTCAVCGLCNGQKADVWAPEHGPGKGSKHDNAHHWPRPERKRSPFNITTEIGR